MEIDTQRIDDALLALFYLGLHDQFHAWKGFDWDALNGLYEQDFILNPRGKAKSIVFTDAGLERSRQLLNQLFGKQN